VLVCHSRNMRPISRGRHPRPSPGLSPRSRSRHQEAGTALTVYREEDDNTDWDQLHVRKLIDAVLAMAEKSAAACLSRACRRRGRLARPGFLGTLCF